MTGWTMSDEQTLQLKKKKVALETEEDRVCIIHYCHWTADGEIKPLTESGFATISNTTAKQQAHANPSVRQDEICIKVPGHHHWCYSNFTSVTSLAIPASYTWVATDNSCISGSVGNWTSSRCPTDCKSQGPLFPQDKCI